MNTNDTPIPSSIPSAEASDPVADRCAVASGSVTEDSKCEGGCEAPVVGHDSEGVPLCQECLDDLRAQPCCERCGGEGWIDYLDGDGSDWGEDCPSEENHPITCRACRGTGVPV